MINFLYVLSAALEVVSAEFINYFPRKNVQLLIYESDLYKDVCLAFTEGVFTVRTFRQFSAMGLQSYLVQ